MVHANCIRILVLHSDPVAREGLLATFRRCPDLQVVDEEDAPGSGTATPAVLVRRVADVVVADYESGITLAGNVTRQGGVGDGIRIMVVASADREWEIRRALELGVRGYVVAGCLLDELVVGVRALHRGGRHLSPCVVEKLAESISGEPLTTREEEVLRLVAAGLGNKAIARTLDIAVGTVKSHLKGVFDKLNVLSRTQAICAAERRGLLRFMPPRSNVAGELQEQAVAGVSLSNRHQELAPEPRESLTA